MFLASSNVCYNVSMRIYVAHPTSLDYENNIYIPFRSDSFFNQHELILPHEASSHIHSSREDYKNVDLVIAECSQPSTGMGIELGWFYDENKPIFYFYQAGTKPSNAISIVAKTMVKYKDKEDFVNKAKEAIVDYTK